jgi:hypothetical protein
MAGRVRTVNIVNSATKLAKVQQRARCLGKAGALPERSANRSGQVRDEDVAVDIVITGDIHHHGSDRLVVKRTRLPQDERR